MFVEFLKKMLRKDQEERATVSDLLDDEWLTNFGEDPINLYME